MHIKGTISRHPGLLGGVVDEGKNPIVRRGFCYPVSAVSAGSRFSGASQLATTNLPEISWLPSTSPPSSPIGSIESEP